MLQLSLYDELAVAKNRRIRRARPQTVPDAPKNLGGRPPKPQTVFENAVFEVSSLSAQARAELRVLLDETRTDIEASFVVIYKRFEDRLALFQARQIERLHALSGDSAVA